MQISNEMKFDLIITFVLVLLDSLPEYDSARVKEFPLVNFFLDKFITLLSSS